MSNDKATRTPTQARGIEKRRRLMDAAAHLFARDGFDGTNAKGIAREAGVSVGTFYAYFRDKKELLMQILAEHMDTVDHSVFGKLEAAVHSGASAREIMRMAVAAGHASHTHSPGLMRVMLALRHTDEDMRRLHEAEERALLARLRAILEPLAPRLRVADREAAAVVLSTAFEAVLHLAVICDQDIERERLFEALADMGATYLFTDPDARG